jgi:hypothetical protein
MKSSEVNKDIVIMSNLIKETKIIHQMTSSLFYSLLIQVGLCLISFRFFLTFESYWSSKCFVFLHLFHDIQKGPRLTFLYWVVPLIAFSIIFTLIINIYYFYF